MIAVWIAFAIQGAICFVLQDFDWFQQNIQLVSWVVILVTSVVFVVAVAQKHRYSSAIIAVIFLGYFIRIGLLIWDLYFYQVVNLFHSGLDTERFYAEAGQLLHGLRDEAGTYQTFLFRFFQVFGQSRILAQYLNILLSMTAVFTVYQILLKCQVEKRATITMLSFAMLTPHFMLLNVVLLREALITALVAFSFYFFVLWFKDNNFLGLAAAFLLVMAAAYFHSGSAAIMAGYAACVVFYSRKHGSFRIKFTSLFWAVALATAFFAIDYLWGDTIFRHWRFEDAQDLADHFARDPRGGAAYAINIATGNAILDIIVNTPIRTVYFMLSPMPWDWRGAWDVAAFAASSTFYIIFYVTTIRSLRGLKGENRSLIIMILLTSVICAVIFGWGVSNAGTALRHRDKFFLQHVLMFTLCARERALSKIPKLLGA